MQQIIVQEIQRNPSKYLNQVEAGESFIIVQEDKPIAELKPITNSKENNKKPSRLIGLCKGEFTVPDDFDAPLPEDILDAFTHFC
jgi:antitoxin (DNA-binding transcriptional repressor) of toxin-antitoxin stability system